MGRDSPNFLPPGGDSPTNSPDMVPSFLSSSWERPPLPPLAPTLPFHLRPGVPLFAPLFSQYLLHHQSLLTPVSVSSSKSLFSSILPHSLPMAPLPSVSTPPSSPSRLSSPGQVSPPISPASIPVAQDLSKAPVFDSAINKSD